MSWTVLLKHLLPTFKGRHKDQLSCTYLHSSKTTAPAPRNMLQAIVLKAFMFMLNFTPASSTIDFSHSDISDSWNSWKEPIGITEYKSLLLARLPKTKPYHQEQTHLELWQAWCRDHFPGETVPVTNHPLREELFSNAQSELELTYLEMLVWLQHLTNTTNLGQNKILLLPWVPDQSARIHHKHSQGNNCSKWVPHTPRMPGTSIFVFYFFLGDYIDLKY